MRDWQPIETAPKDGTRILVHDYAEPVFARWGDTMLSSQEKDWMGEGGRRLQGATHWMPLPAAPA